MPAEIDNIIGLKEYLFYNVPAGNRRLVLEERLRDLRNFSTALLFNLCGDQSPEARDSVENKIKVFELVVSGVLPPANIRDN